MRKGELRNLVGLTLVALIASVGAFGEETPDVSLVAIQSVSAAGTGCQAGTVAASFSPDKKAFSVLFDRYQADAGGPNPSADKKTCDVGIEIQVPAGWQFALSSADYRGFAAVDANATAFHQVVYSFGTPQGRGTFKASFSLREFRGPVNQEYSIRNELTSGVVAWSPCDVSATKRLTISTGLVARMLGRTAGPRASISLDSVDGALDQSFGLTWRRCSSVAPTPIPSAPPAAAQTLTVYSAKKGGDVLTSIDPREIARTGYTGAMAVFKTLQRQTAVNQVALYRCVILPNRVHFVSASAGCEGRGRAESSLGFISTAPGTGWVQIARYRNVQVATEYLTVPVGSVMDSTRYRLESVLGYALSM